MPETKKKQQASSDTVKTQIAALSLTTATQKETIKRLRKDNDALKTHNLELASVIENDLKADLTLRIMASSKYSKEELGNLDVKQLKNIEETLSKTEAATSATYKTIRAGNAGFDHSARLTVGSLYKKPEVEN